ncbi:MAG TPA: 50S ribosomal protein L24 [Polyangiaceae bacterium]|jgi:large subunit ribosomal protein L24
MRRIKVGDEVVVIRGNHKSKRGKVTRVSVKRNSVIIGGVNVVKRHIRATQQRPGGILEVEAPIQMSKVMLVDPQTNKPTRVSFQTQEGKKRRIAKSGVPIAPAES